MSKKVKEENNKEAVEQGDASKNLLNSLLEGYKEDHYAFIKSDNKIISTGSLLLDSLVRIRSGSVVRLVGKGAELGKTSECLVLSSNYMNVMEKSKTLYIKSEARLSEEMQKRSGHKFVFSASDWNYGTTYVLPCNIFETIAQIIESLLKTMHEQGEHLCIILDSLDGCILKSDMAKNLFGGDNVKLAGVPLMTKLLFRRLALSINHYDSLLLVTGQYSADIKIDPYSPSVPRQGESSGGSSIAHQADTVFQYLPRYQGDMILKNPDEKPDVNKNPIIGIYATVEIKKSSTDVSGTKVKIPIKKNVIGCAIWKSKEVGDMILSWDLAKKAGAWITFGELIIKEAKESGIDIKEKVNGLNALYEYLEEDATLCNWFYEKFKKLNEV
jgi:hypothetical protein